MTASAGETCEVCTEDLCAERRLVQRVVRQVATQRRPTAYHVRRALGVVCVERYRADGSAGCSLPCHGCRTVLRRLDARVRCVDTEGAWITARVDALPGGGIVTLADQRRWGRRR